MIWGLYPFSHVLLTGQLLQIHGLCHPQTKRGPYPGDMVLVTPTGVHWDRMGSDGPFSIRLSCHIPSSIPPHLCFLLAPFPSLGGLSCLLSTTGPQTIPYTVHTVSAVPPETLVISSSLTIHSLDVITLFSPTLLDSLKSSTNYILLHNQDLDAAQKLHSLCGEKPPARGYYWQGNLWSELTPTHHGKKGMPTSVLFFLLL